MFGRSQYNSLSGEFSKLNSSDYYDVFLQTTKQMQVEKITQELNVSELLVALRNGLQEVVGAYIEVILKSNLDSAVKEALLAAKDQRGTPGLYYALRSGQLGTLKTYIEAIAASDLDMSVKVNLLSARDKEGTSGLFIALRCGQHEAVKVYMKAVSKSGLRLQLKTM